MEYSFTGNAATLVYAMGDNAEIGRMMIVRPESDRVERSLSSWATLLLGSAIVAVVLALFLPVLVFFVIGAGLVVSIWILPRVIRFFRGVFRRVRGWFSPATA